MSFLLGLGIGMSAVRAAPAPEEEVDPYEGLTLLTSDPYDIDLWPAGSVTVMGGAEGPTGELDAFAMLETAVNDNQKHVLQFVPSHPNLITGRVYMQETIAKTIGGRWLLHRTFVDGYGSGIYQWFDLVNGELGLSGGYGSAVQKEDALALIEPVGNDFYRCRNFFTALSNAAVNEAYFNSQTGDNSDGAFDGDVNKGLYIFSGGLYIQD